MSSIVKIKEALARQRVKHKEQTQMVEGRLVSAATGFALGYAEREKMIPTMAFGGKVPVKALLAVAAHFVSATQRGNVGRVAGSAADALAGIYSYAAGKSGSYIAGDE
jgi:hypothetical protein